MINLSLKTFRLVKLKIEERSEAGSKAKFLLKKKKIHSFPYYDIIVLNSMFLRLVLPAAGTIQ